MSDAEVATEETGDSGGPTHKRAHETESLARSFFDYFGGSITEFETEGGYPASRVELPKSMVEPFRAPTLEIAFSPKVEGAVEVVTPGSRVFDTMLEWLQDQGQVAWVPLRSDHEPPEKPDDSKEIEKREVKPGYDLEVAVRISFIAEERHEELALLHIPAVGKMTEVDESIVQQAYDEGLVDLHADIEPPTSGWLSDTLDEVVDWINNTWSRERARPREQAIYERLSKEVQRLTNYYGELMANNERNDDLREQLAEDLDRRVAEEVANHKLVVEVEILCYAVVARTIAVYVDVDGDTWSFDAATGEMEVRHGDQT